MPPRSQRGAGAIARSQNHEHSPSRTPLKEDTAVSPDRKRAEPRGHAPWDRFARHYLEMAAVMGIGMFAAAFVFMITLNLAVEDGVTWEEALLDYPVHALLAVAIGMSLPMIPWMRHRGHNRKSAYEMAAVMGILAIPFVCLALFDVVRGAQCGLHCGIGYVAMLGLMLLRRDQYGVDRSARIRTMNKRNAS